MHSESDTAVAPARQAPAATKTQAPIAYLLHLADNAVVLGQRNAEWCGHAPILEEDIALTNLALDLIGQARALLTRAGQIGHERGAPLAFDEDQLAFLREERDYLNPTLVELPRGDFAFTVLRNAAVATWMRLMWTQLQASRDAELAAIAAKALERGIGARGLRAVMEGVLTPIMYDIPSDHTIEQVTITAGADDAALLRSLGSALHVG